MQRFTSLQIFSGFKFLRNTKPNLGSGFTLIELVIYSAIVGVMLILMIGLFWNIISSNIKETAYQTVQQNTRFAIIKITQEVKGASGINNPLPGFSSDSLSLSMADSSLDPTLFDLVEGKLRITQGSFGPYELTSDEVQVSSLQFTNLSYPDTPGTIRIVMVLDHINPGGRIEYQASISVKSTVSLMPGGSP